MAGAGTRYDYCKIFLNGLDREAAQRAVVRLLDGTPQRFFSIQSEFVHVDVRRNDDHDPSRLDDFLFWPIYLDVMRRPNASNESVRASVSALLRGLWQGDVDAVPACDFEDELPSPGESP